MCFISFTVKPIGKPFTHIAGPDKPERFDELDTHINAWITAQHLDDPRLLNDMIFNPRQAVTYIRILDMAFNFDEKLQFLSCHIALGMQIHYVDTARGEFPQNIKQEAYPVLERQGDKSRGIVSGRRGHFPP